YGNPIRTSTPRDSHRSHRALSECTIMNLELHQPLPHAVDKGIAAYVTSRRASIPRFIHQHFSHSPGFSGRPMSLRWCEQLTPRFLLLRDIWALFRRHIGEKITSIISMACHFTTKSGGICNYLL